MNQTVTIIQITDLHILAKENQKMADIETEKSFKQVLKHIHATYSSIDLLLITGDLAQDPCLPCYHRIEQALKKYSTRTICLPGNHDDIALMEQVFMGKQVNCDKYIQLQNWQLISLNSKKENASGGYLASSELSFLRDSLEKNPHSNTVIAVHHHPIPTHSLWMDTMTIENSAELFAILKQHPQVKVLCCGHIHQEIESIQDNILILGTPSTCFQFKPLSVDYTLDENRPGYRLLSLLPNGSIQSKVFRLPSQV